MPSYQCHATHDETVVIGIMLLDVMGDAKPVRRRHIRRINDRGDIHEYQTRHFRAIKLRHVPHRFTEKTGTGTKPLAERCIPMVPPV